MCICISYLGCCALNALIQAFACGKDIPKTKLRVHVAGGSDNDRFTILSSKVTGALKVVLLFGYEYFWVVPCNSVLGEGDVGIYMNNHTYVWVYVCMSIYDFIYVWTHKHMNVYVLPSEKGM